MTARARERNRGQLGRADGERRPGRREGAGHVHDLGKHGERVSVTRTPLNFVFPEHFESGSLHGYRRRLKSPLDSKEKFARFSESHRDADFELFAGAHGTARSVKSALPVPTRPLGAHNFGTGMDCQHVL